MVQKSKVSEVIKQFINFGPKIPGAEFALLLA